jgi:hypothetical protein
MDLNAVETTILAGKTTFRWVLERWPDDYNWRRMVIRNGA